MEATLKLVEELSGKYQINNELVRFTNLISVISNEKLSDMNVRISVIHQKNELADRELLVNYYDELVKYYFMYPELFTDKLSDFHSIVCMLSKIF